MLWVARRLVLSLFAVLSATATSATASQTVTPRLNNVFISLNVRPNWTRARWRSLFADLTSIQVTTVIVADAVTPTSDPPGGYKAWYPTKIAGHSYDGTDVLGMALEEAATAKVGVFLGLLQPADWFHNGAMNATYLRELVVRENAVLQELHALYGAHEGDNEDAAAALPTLRGFYHPAELYSTCCESSVHQCDAPHTRALAAMVEPTAKLAHALSSKYTFVIAPFDNFWPDAVTPSANVSAAMTAWWSGLLAQTPSVDVVALQDGVGVSAGNPVPRSPTRASQLIAAVSRAVVGHKKQMWTDIEIFSHPDYSVASTARVLEQIQREAPFVSGMTIWEFTSFMDPRNCSTPGSSKSVACKRLYEDYRRYLDTGGKKKRQATGATGATRETEASSQPPTCSISTEDQTRKLSPCTSAEVPRLASTTSSAPSPAPSPSTPGSWKLAVDDTASGQRQSIDGFGAAWTDATVTVFDALPADAQDTLLHELFSPTPGSISLSLMRHTIGQSVRLPHSPHPNPCMLLQSSFTFLSHARALTRSIACSSHSLRSFSCYRT